MDSKNQGQGTYPVISKDWLESRYGVIVAASIFAEIQRTDGMVQAANDIEAVPKIA